MHDKNKNRQSMSEGFRVMAREKALAEQFLVIMNDFGRKDITQYAKGVTLYAEAKAEFDGLLTELEALIEPWDVYRALQSLGSAVWLPKYQMFALARYESVIRALKDASAFSSASGVMMNDEMNQVLRGNPFAVTARITNACVALSRNRSLQRR